MYLDRYKACHTIFEGIPKIDLGDVHLRGFFPEKLDIESKMYLANSNDLFVKKYLPGAYVSTEQEARMILDDYINRFIFKCCVPFTIATRERSIPIGYIMCNSPLISYKDSKERIDDWTIDFWLASKVRGKRIMEPILYNVLVYLQEKELDRVYMYVDKDNFVSIHIIEKCKLIHIGESGDGKLYKYGVKFKRNVSLF